MYSCTTRGCSSPSSHSSASRSANTMSAIAPRSISPRGSSTRSPKRSTTAWCTSSSACSRRWTMSSLEIVAAPCRAKAASASLFPAPMPPVMATAIGRAKLLGLFGGALGLGGRLGLGSGFFRCELGLLGLRFLGKRLLGSGSGLGLRLGGGLRHCLHGCLGSLRLLGLRDLGDGLRRLREHLFREVEIWRALDRLPVVDALLHAAALDPLEREREAAPLGIDLDDLRAHEITLRDHFTRVLDVVLRELGDVNEPLDAGHDLDEGAERDDLGHLALDLVALVVGLEHLLPRIGLGLLQAQRDALALAVDVEHLHLHVL